MRILIVGGGGREHALAWKVAQSPLAERVFVAPGNAGTALEPRVCNLDVAAEDIPSLLEFACNESIELTIIGPEVALVNGIVDCFEAAGLRIFGPTAAAARLEGSKTFAKNFLQRHRIPTAEYASFSAIEPAIEYIKSKAMPIVVKADGLAAGKGVILAENETQAIAAVRDMLSGNMFGIAGHCVVIEAFLVGEEASFICMVDGETVLPMATSQDHKARDNADTGPNTGGMGAYSPAPVITAAVEQAILQSIVQPTVEGLVREGIRYRGFLYVGLMIDTEGNARVLEYNCRLGDPETQPLMMRLQSDLVSLCLAACSGELAGRSITWDERSSLGVVLAARGYPDHFAKGEMIESLPEATEALQVFHAGTARDLQDNLISNGGRVLCVTALGDDIDSAQGNAYAGVDKIDWDGAYYRTDIGFKAVTGKK